MRYQLISPRLSRSCGDGNRSLNRCRQTGHGGFLIWGSISTCVFSEIGLGFLIRLGEVVESISYSSYCSLYYGSDLCLREID